MCCSIAVETSGCAVEEIGVIVDGEVNPSTVMCTRNTMTLKFIPLLNDVAIILCSKCIMDFAKEIGVGPTISGSLGNVCKTDTVVQDGNSFFRAVAKVISGSEKSHRKIRLVVDKYMENHSEHMKLVGKEYASVSEYNDKSQMRKGLFCNRNSGNSKCLGSSCIYL